MPRCDPLMDWKQFKGIPEVVWAHTNHAFLGIKYLQKANILASATHCPRHLQLHFLLFW